MTGLSKAIEQQGGLTSLAHSLGLSKGVVFQWTVRGRVPPKYCPKIEKLTHGEVKCEDLNDEVDWSSVRNAPAPDADPDHTRRVGDKEPT